MAPRAWMHLGSDILLSHLPSRAPFLSFSSLIPQPPSLAAPLTLVGIPVLGVMSILCPRPSVAGHKQSLQGAWDYLGPHLGSQVHVWCPPHPAPAPTKFLTLHGEHIGRSSEPL